MSGTAVLLSGGLDSAVLLADEIERSSGTVQPIYVSVGLAWEQAERDAVAALLATTEAALHRGRALTAADAPFSATLVADMPPAERYVLLNQCTPGLGRDDAPVIVVGTEAAFPRPCCCSTADRRGTRVGGNWHVCFWTRAGQPTWSWRKRPSDDHSLRPQGVATDWSCSHAP